MIDLEYFRQHCLVKKGVTEEFPFDEHTLVFKVMGKMFALTGLQREEFAINLKCDPERAEELRELHPEIEPGYHMSKKHWNTVNCVGTLDGRLIINLIDDSYDLVVKSLTKKLKLELENL